MTDARQLATIQKITDIRAIEGADKIEVCQVLGWECVTKKGEHKVGDLVVYVEIDSILPERAEFEFLRERKFRIKTIKLKKQVSQGIVFGTSILPAGTSILEGTDVTDLLGIKKHDPQATDEQKLQTSASKSKVIKYLMGYAIFRWVYFKLNTVDKGWPSWIQKTDEERIQVCALKLVDNLDRLWYVTEKLDGQSGTFFYHKTRKWGVPSWQFGVCSRNIWLKKANASNYWKIAQKLGLENKFKKLKQEIVVQGEILNTNVQGNKYKVTEPDFYVFNVVVDGKRCTLIEMLNFCDLAGLKVVPIMASGFIPATLCAESKEVKDVVQAMVKLSAGISKLAPVQREGIVCRLVDDTRVSFKAINPEFLLKFNE